MDLSDTQRDIEGAIRSICAGEPFATIDDIAELSPFTRRTVLNNVDEVVEGCPDIDTRKAGRARVFYVKQDRSDELMGDGVQDIYIFQGLGGAAYAQVVVAADESDFDFEVCWYGPELNELHDYIPSHEECGNVARTYADEPVSIRYLNGGGDS